MRSRSVARMFLLSLCFAWGGPLASATDASAQASYEIRGFHQQRRCVARVLSDEKDIELLVGYSRTLGLQVVLFSGLFERHEGQSLRGAIGFRSDALLTGTFRLAGPAISLSFGEIERGVFRNGVTRGDTLTVSLERPISRTARFDFSAASNLADELVACVDRL